MKIINQTKEELISELTKLNRDLRKLEMNIIQLESSLQKKKAEFEARLLKQV